MRSDYANRIPMNRRVYKHLTQLNCGFEDVLDSLRVLRKQHRLNSATIHQLEALTKETRASINSYLLEAFASVETAAADRSSWKRVARERTTSQEMGPSRHLEGNARTNHH